jgi:hypothetical protein
MKLLTRKKEAEIAALVERLRRFDQAGLAALTNDDSAMAGMKDVLAEMAKLSAVVSEPAGRVAARGILRDHCTVQEAAGFGGRAMWAPPDVQFS